MPLYKGDIGVALKATLKTGTPPSCTALDLTDADVFLVIEYPSGAVVEFEAEVVSARRGEVQYVTTSEDDLGEDGTYRMQARVETAADEVFHSGYSSFEVSEVLVPDA